MFLLTIMICAMFVATFSTTFALQKTNYSYYDNNYAALISDAVRSGSGLSVSKNNFLTDLSLSTNPRTGVEGYTCYASFTGHTSNYRYVSDIITNEF